MEKVKSLKEGQKYIAQIIDGELTIVDLSGDRLHTDASRNLFWRSKILATLDDLKEGVEDVEYDEGTAEITVTYHDGRTPLVIRVPHLDLIDDMEYDDDTKEIVLVKKDGTKDIRVPVGHLIDIYTGLPGAQINIEVTNDNKIKAILIEGTIAEEHLTAALQAKIAKIEDIEQGLEELTQQVEQAAEGLKDHTHDGVDSKKISYVNLTNKPVDKFTNANVTSDWTVDIGSNMFNAEYVVSKGSLRESGLLKVRGDDITHLDIIGDDDELDMSFTVSGNNLTVTNGGGGSASVQMLVTYL